MYKSDSHNLFTQTPWNLKIDGTPYNVAMILGAAQDQTKIPYNSAV